MANRLLTPQEFGALLAKSIREAGADLPEAERKKLQRAIVEALARCG